MQQVNWRDRKSSLPVGAVLSPCCRHSRGNTRQLAPLRCILPQQGNPLSASTLRFPWGKIAVVVQGDEMWSRFLQCAPCPSALCSLQVLALGRLGSPVRGCAPKQSWRKPHAPVPGLFVLEPVQAGAADDLETCLCARAADQQLC